MFGSFCWTIAFSLVDKIVDQVFYETFNVKKVTVLNIWGVTSMFLVKVDQSCLW